MHVPYTFGLIAPFALIACLRGQPAPAASASGSTPAPAPAPAPAVGAPVGAPLPPSAGPQCPRQRFDLQFSPKSGVGCTELIISLIGEAKKTIRLQAYGFTSEPIAKALAKAQSNGVDVQALLDKSNVDYQYSKAGLLRAAKAQTFVDAKHAIAHNKVLIVDGRHVETGSFNYTAAAEKSNAENCLVIRDNEELASKYTESWESHKAHSSRMR